MAFECPKISFATLLNYKIISLKNMGRSIWRSLAANASLTVGVFLGIKAADKLMWNSKKYEQMKEQIEIDYWKKYGQPT